VETLLTNLFAAPILETSALLSAGARTCPASNCPTPAR
jgi:hypothetical protein